ncbi:MAG: hypothetical protein ACLSAC_13050 [Enterocloster bolteae]
MFTRINSGGIWAVEGVLVSVEADVSDMACRDFPFQASWLPR